MPEPRQISGPLKNLSGVPYADHRVVIELVSGFYTPDAQYIRGVLNVRTDALGNLTALLVPNVGDTASNYRLTVGGEVWTFTVPEGTLPLTWSEVRALGVVEGTPQYRTIVAFIESNPALTGASAYESWLAAGNVGTEAVFLAGLEGADGITPELRVNQGVLEARYGAGEWAVLTDLARNVSVACDNGTAITIPKGAAVYVTGLSVDGLRPRIALAQANAGATMFAIGLTATAIDPGATGRVLQEGLLSGVDTSASVVGTVLSVHKNTAGALSNIKFGAPVYEQRAAIVLAQSATAGQLLVSMGSVVERGVANGLPSLGSDGKIPFIQIGQDYSGARPEAFGAVGDGVTNDAAAISAARNFANTNGLPLQFGPKTYRCDGIIDIFSGMLVRGIKGKTVLKAGANMQAILRLSNALADIEIENLTIDMQKGVVAHNSTNGYGIFQFTAAGTVADRVTIRGVRIINAAKYGATFSRVNDLIIDDFIVENAGTVAGDRSFNVFSGTRVNLSRVRTLGGISVGTAVHDSSDVRIRDCNVINAGNNGFQLFSVTGGSIQGSKATGSTLNGCEVDGCTDFDVLPGNEFSDNLFHGLHVSRDTSPNPVRDISVVGIKAHRNRFNGISVIGLARGAIVGNECKDNAQADVADWQAGIQIQQNQNGPVVPTGLTVTGNVATDTQATKTQKYGIWLRDTIANSVVTGNMTAGNATAGTQNSTASTSLVLANNL